MTDLTTRIADARKKVEAEIATGWATVKIAVDRDLFIEMADEIAALKTDRDTWRTNYFKDIEDLQKEIAALTAKLEKARQALEPFAKAADELIPGTPDTAGVMWDGIVAMANAGHLRAAARVHAETKADPG